MRVIVQPTTISQVVSLEVLLNYSALDEPADSLGIRQVLATTMLQGSSDGAAVLHRLTMAGGKLEGHVQQDAIEFSVIVPADGVGAGLSVLADVICRPALNDNGIRLAIAQSRARVGADLTNAVGIASWMSQQLLFLDHPYASRGAGFDSTLAALTPQLVRNAYHQHIVPGAVVLAVAGRCVDADTRVQVAALFSDWHGAEPPISPAMEPPTLPESRLELREAPVNNACVLLAFPVCGVMHPDFLALRVTDALLGGGAGSRLFRSVRDQQRLAYEVATSLPSQLAGSSFTLYALTSSSALDQTKTAMTDELVRLQTEPVSAADLQRAKAYLKGRYLLGHQYSAQYAFDLAWYEMIDAGIAYDRALPGKIDAITAADIQRVARTYFTNYYCIVIIPSAVDVTGK